MKKKMRGASKLGLKCLAAVLGSLVLLGSSLLITEHREKMEAYALEQEGVADFVSRLYTEVLNRTPDEAGLNAWCDGLLDGTLTGAEVAKGFIMSNEFLGKDMEHEEFVQIMYSAFFGREAAPKEVTDWVAYLNLGYRKSFIFAGFANSNEFKALCGNYGVNAGEVPVTVSEQQPGLTEEEYNTWLFVERLYTEVLDRIPDMGGLSGWADYLQAGTYSGAEVAEGFIMSPEFQAKEITSEEYVTVMYSAFFGRGANPEEVAAWVELMDNGCSKRFVFSGFANSGEFETLCNSYNINRGTIEIKIGTPEAPYEFTSNANGVTLSWNALDGATRYGVWRSETGADGTYEWVGNAADTTYVDTTVENRGFYYYKLTAYEVGLQQHGAMSGAIRTVYADTYEAQQELWNAILADNSRFGMWELTYSEFLELYWSIGTGNDLFAKMLKEKGPRHTDTTLWYEYDGVANLNISFEDELTEKIYALHYAPFEYNFADYQSGNYTKSTLEAYNDHGGVCGILSSTYEHFIRDILGETGWTFCNYGNEAMNHEVLLVKTADGRVFQVDNAGVDYWWLGLEFAPDYSKYQSAKQNEEAAWRLETWQEDYASENQAYWHNFSFVYNFDKETNAWHRRPVWYDYAAGEFTACLDAEMPTHYKVTFRGLQGKVISMAGNAKLDGYVNLDELVFE